MIWIPLGVLILLVLAAVIAAPYLETLDDRKAVKLNLRPRRYRMAAIGDSKNLSISPTNAAGHAAPVTDIAWDFGGAVGVVNPDDSKLATVKFDAVGTFVVTVSAKDIDGETLTDSKTYTVAEDQKAVALNLAEV